MCVARTCLLARDKKHILLELRKSSACKPCISQPCHHSFADDEAEEKAQPVADTGAPPKNAIQAATDALMIGVINAVVLIPDVLACAPLDT